MLKKICKKVLALVLAFSMAAPVVPPVTSKAQEAATETVINVTDYGADPSGKHDSTKAVMDALETAKSIEGEKILNFPMGEYRFDKDHASTRVYHTSNTSSRNYPEKKISILLENIEDLTIEGNNSTLLVYGDIMALAVVDSTNIKIQNLVLDYKDADTIDISIVKTAVDESNRPYADIYIPAAYNYEISQDGKHIQWQGEISPLTGKPYWTWTDADFCAYLVVYKGYDRTVIRATDKQASNPFTGVESITQVDDSTVRFTYASQLPRDIVEGNIYQLSNSAWRQTAGAFFWESEKLTVENIDVHYLSGFGWLTQMCKDVEFKEVDFLPRDGSGKYTTSNADQLHVAGCGGYFKVTNCNFSMAHDDPINVHGTYLRVEEVIDSRTIRMQYIHGQQGGFRQFHAGDEVLFYSRTFLEPPNSQTEDTPYIVESSVGPGELYNGPATSYDGKKLDLVTEIVTFKDPLPEALLEDLRIKVTKDNSLQGLYVAENVSYTPAVTISGNRMKSIPTRGILCTTRQDVIIENNIFDNMAMANIYLSNDAEYWYESGPIRNMIIRNNTFYVRPTGQNEWGTVGGIFVDPVTLRLDGQTPKNPDNLVHKNITIEGNTFHISNDNVVTANRVDGLTIKNNRIIHDDPSLAITVNTKPALNIGEAQDISVTVNETILQKDIFQFNDCRNVTVENNTYDEGMNLNIRLDQKTPTSELTLGSTEQALLKVNQTNHVSSSSKVQLLSTNPAVAYIEETGRLKAVSQGTTNIYAYIEKNGTIIKSNEVTVTVQNTETETLTLEVDKTYFESTDESVALTASSENVTYSLVDPLTKKPTDKAVITNNTYHPKKDGAVLIKAATDSDTAELLMVNSLPLSYGSQGGLEDGITITEPTDNGTYSTDQHSVTIVPQQNGNGIWQTTATINNLVNLSIPEQYRQDLRLQVTAKGLVTKESGYNSSGIILYTDFDNYVFAGKRNHINGVSTIVEQAQVGPETPGDAKANTLTDLTFEFVIEESTLKIRYQDPEGNWNDVKTCDISFLQSQDMKLGLISWKNSGPDFLPTYSNIRMAKATESSEDMSNIAPIALYKSFTNDRPEIQSVTLTGGAVNENATATVTPQNLSSTLYQWKLETAGGVVTAYTSEPQYTPTEEGTLTVTAIGFDDYNKPSQPVTGNPVEITINTNDSDQLQHLYINGNPIKDFAPDRYDYEITVPEAMERLRLSYDAADAGKITKINGAEEITLEANVHSAILDIHYSYTITRGDVTYTLNVTRVKGSQNKPTEIKVGDRIVDLSKEIKPGTDSYFIHPDADSFPLRITTQEGVSEIKVTRSYFEKEVEDKNQQDNVFEADIEMKAGINAYYIYITAADGVSTREVKLYFFRDAYADAQLNGILVNGEVISGFSPEIKDYTIRLSQQEAEGLTITAQPKNGQDTSITYKNHRTDDITLQTNLVSGLNEIIIANAAKDLWTKNFYTLNIIVESNDNAELLSLSANQLMTPSFSAGTTSYQLKNNNGKLTVSAVAQVAEADINMYLKGSEQSVVAKGQLSHEFSLYEGTNRIVIDVTAADGITKKVYEILVLAKGLVYASDVVENGSLEGIRNTTTDVGYGNYTLDTNIDGTGKIALPDADGNKVSFDKGLGVHASSQIIFQLEQDHNYEYFEAYAGIDFSKYSFDASTVRFEVWVDNQKVYDSTDETGGPVRATTPMQFVQVDIRNAAEIKLITDKIDSNSYDHSVWADACFTRSLPPHPNPELPQPPSPDEDDPDGNKGLWIQGINEEYPYTGRDIKPAIKVYEGNRLLIEKKDYTLVYKNTKNAFPYAQGEEGFEANKAKAPSVQIKMKGNNSGGKTIYYKITPIDIAEAQLAADKLTAVVKPGKKASVTPVLYWNGKKLVQNKDYKVEGTLKNLEQGEYFITINGNGNFAGKITDVKITVTNDTSDNYNVVSMSKVSVQGLEKSLPWTSEGVSQNNCKVTYKKTELHPTEYNAVVRNGKKVGTAYLILTGTGVEGNNDGFVFTGTKTIPFKVTGTQMNKRNIVIEGVLDRTYNDGKPILPTTETMEDGTPAVRLKVKNHTDYLTEGTHYTVSYSKNIEKGTATVTFTGREEEGFTGSYKKTFKINAKPVTELTISIPSATITGEKQTVPYTKGSTTPAVEVRTGDGRILEASKDYTVTYKNNKNVGQEATILVKGKGNYGDSATLSFTILQKELSNENGIQVIAKDKVSNGKPNNWKQSVKVLDSNNKALNSKDYDTQNIEFYLIRDSKGNTVEEELDKSIMVDPGSLIEVRVKGKGIYAAQNGKEAIATGTYRILPKGYDISKATIKLNPQSYTGTPVTIADQKQFTEGKVFIKLPNKQLHTLILGEDIEVVKNSYIKNINKGTAKVTFRGIGDFGGTKTVSFKINSRDTSNLWEILRNILNIQ